jgi:hypothetical protein
MTAQPTTLDFAWIRDVRANYKQRKVTVVFEFTLSREVLENLPPVITAAQTETPVKLTVERAQEMLPGLNVEVKRLS